MISGVTKQCMQDIYIFSSFTFTGRNAYVLVKHQVVIKTKLVHIFPDSDDGQH